MFLYSTHSQTLVLDECEFVSEHVGVIDPSMVDSHGCDPDQDKEMNEGLS